MSDLDELYERAVTSEDGDEPECGFCCQGDTPIYIVKATGYGVGPYAHEDTTACGSCLSSFVVSSALAGLPGPTAGEKDVLVLAHRVEYLIGRLADTREGTDSE